MRPGRLEHRITIQKNTPTRGTTGEELDSWSTHATVWAEMRTQGGAQFSVGANEYDLMNMMVAKTHVIFRVRFVAGVTQKMRVLYRSRYYDIVGVVDEAGEQRWLNLLCAEQMAAV